MIIISSLHWKRYQYSATNIAKPSLSLSHQHDIVTNITVAEIWTESLPRKVTWCNLHRCWWRILEMCKLLVTTLRCWVDFFIMNVTKFTKKRQMLWLCHPSSCTHIFVLFIDHLSCIQFSRKRSSKSMYLRKVSN